MELTDSQRDQLRAFLEEQGASEQRVRVAALADPPREHYIEAVLLGADGEPTSHKRILFPN